MSALGMLGLLGYIEGYDGGNAASVAGHVGDLSLGAGRVENVGQFGAEFPDRLLVCLHDTYGNASTLVYDGVHERDAKPTGETMLELHEGSVHQDERYGPLTVIHVIDETDSGLGTVVFEATDQDGWAYDVIEGIAIRVGAA